MQRSTMVRKLQASILFHTNPPQGHCCFTDDEMYSHILQDLEDEGMAPQTESGRWDPVDVEEDLQNYMNMFYEKWSKK